MAAARDAARQAGSLYRKTLAFLRIRAHKIEAEVEHLREVEQAGESGEAPFIAIVGVLLFLLPIVALLLGIAFTVYFLAG
jgi:hypothetical protein